MNCDERGLSPARRVPHSWQNFEDARFWEPHLEQVRVSDAPHCEQCLLEPGFSVAQVGHCMSDCHCRCGRGIGANEHQISYVNA